MPDYLTSSPLSVSLQINGNPGPAKTCYALSPTYDSLCASTAQSAASSGGRFATLIGYDGGMAADVFTHDIYFAINYWFLGAVALVAIAAVTYWWRSKRRH
jgi:hypothetical protein